MPEENLYQILDGVPWAPLAEVVRRSTPSLLTIIVKRTFYLILLMYNRYVFSEKSISIAMWDTPSYVFSFV